MEAEDTACVYPIRWLVGGNPGKVCIPGVVSHSSASCSLLICYEAGFPVTMFVVGASGSIERTEIKVSGGDTASCYTSAMARNKST